MTLKLAKPSGAKLAFRKELPVDADAAAYIAAVEAADGQALEIGVKFAITNFVLCCKQDGIWSSIKASCILAGARTLSGALVPLVGTAPTNFNFVAGDYNRKTGLIGNGSTKYLDSNRNNNADPQNNCHLSAYVSQANSSVNDSLYIGNLVNFQSLHNIGSAAENKVQMWNRGAKTLVGNSARDIGFMGNSRNSATQVQLRAAGSTTITTAVSLSVSTVANISLFRSLTPALSTSPSDARLAFYSIGESLNLALLDARVTDLINAFGAAIP